MRPIVTIHFPEYETGDQGTTLIVKVTDLGRKDYQTSILGLCGTTLAYSSDVCDMSPVIALPGSKDPAETAVPLMCDVSVVRDVAKPSACPDDPTAIIAVH